MLNYTIGAVRRTKKSTTKRKSTPKVKPACSAAGSLWKRKGSSRGAAVLAMCKAVGEGKKLSAKAMKKYKVTKTDLRKRK